MAWRTSDGQKRTACDISSSKKFTVIVLPDTQYYAERWPDIFQSQTRWIVQNKDTLNIQCVVHVGDIVDSYDDHQQWRAANKALQILDDQVPYILAQGNHDIYNNAAHRLSLQLNQYFPVKQFLEKKYWGGSMLPDQIDNYYIRFSAGGLNWLVIALEVFPSDKSLEWAENIIKIHPEHRIMLVTHCYLDLTNKRVERKDRYGPEDYGLCADRTTTTNSGQQMWEKLVKKYANISFVFCGHLSEPKDDTGRLASIGNHGNIVYQFLFDFQERQCGGNGYLAILEFNPEEKTLLIKCYSPYLNQYFTDLEHQFCYSLDLFK